MYFDIGDAGPCIPPLGRQVEDEELVMRCLDEGDPDDGLAAKKGGIHLLNTSAREPFLLLVVKSISWPILVETRTDVTTPPSWVRGWQ